MMHFMMKHDSEYQVFCPADSWFFTNFPAYNFNRVSFHQLPFD